MVLTYEAGEKCWKVAEQQWSRIKNLAEKTSIYKGFMFGDMGDIRIFKHMIAQPI